MAQFVKSHGLGNDYLVIDPADLPFELDPEVIRRICDRNRGVGSDGILVLTPSDTADFGVRTYNPDGSEAEKSGNGIRIFARFLRDRGYTERDAFVIETAGGLVPVALEWEAGRVAQVRASMGTVRFDPFDRIDVNGLRFQVTSLSIGNPHCVVVVPDLDAVDIHVLGPAIETHPAFPNRTNVQFAQVISRSEVRIVIWERGAGYTLASGSSSCAVAAACHRAGLVDSDVRIVMPGGSLEVTIEDDGQIQLRGPVEEVFEGTFSPEFMHALSAAQRPSHEEYART
jgi:diaminopimelate epimerase